MKHLSKERVAAAAALLVLTTAGGVALAAEDPAGWYTGNNGGLADPNKSAVALTLYNASGAPVTTGTTTAPIAAYVGAAGALPNRTADQFGSLFVHVSQPTTAPGAWPGVQVTGTDKFAGDGALTPPGTALAGKPFVRADQAGDYSLANVVSALPTTSTASGFQGVYELRLRTSSPAAGVSDTYATTYLKVTGTTWAVTTAPPTGSTGGGGASSTPPAPASSTPPVVVTTPAAPVTTPAAPVTPPAAPAGKVASSVSFKVSKAPTTKKKGTGTVTVPTASGRPGATGTVQVVLKGKTSKTLKATLSGGTGTVKLPKLKAGTYKVTLSYAGDSTYLGSTGQGGKVKVKAAR